MKIKELNRTYEINFKSNAEITLDETIYILKQVFQCPTDKIKLPFSAKVILTQDPYRFIDINIESICRDCMIIKVKSSFVIPIDKDFLKDETFKLENRLFQLGEFKRSLKILNESSKNLLKELDIKQL